MNKIVTTPRRRLEASPRGSRGGIKYAAAALAALAAAALFAFFSPFSPFSLSSPPTPSPTAPARPDGRSGGPLTFSEQVEAGKSANAPGLSPAAGAAALLRRA